MVLIFAGLTLCALTSRDVWVPQFDTQVMAKQTLPHRIQGLAQFLGFDFQGHPRMITTRQVIPLYPRRPTLTLLTPRQLFDPSV